MSRLVHSNLKQKSKFVTFFSRNPNMNFYEKISSNWIQLSNVDTKIARIIHFGITRE